MKTLARWLKAIGGLTFTFIMTYATDPDFAEDINRLWEAVIAALGSGATVGIVPNYYYPNRTLEQKT